MINKSMIYYSDKKDRPNTHLMPGNTKTKDICWVCGEETRVAEGSTFFDFRYCIYTPVIDFVYYGPPEQKSIDGSDDYRVEAYHGYSTEDMAELSSIKHIYRMNSWYGKDEVYYGIYGEGSWWYCAKDHTWHPLQSMTEENKDIKMSINRLWWDKDENKFSGLTSEDSLDHLRKEFIAAWEK